MSFPLDHTTPITTTTTTNNKRRAKTQSFSSILLDAIYRSIDDDGDADITTITNSTPPITISTPTSKNNNYDNYSTSCNAKQRRSKMRSDSTLETVDLRRAIMIDSWIDKHQQKSPSLDHHDDHIHILRQKSVPSSRSSSRPSELSFSAKLRANLAPRAAESCFRFDHAPPSKRVSSSRIFTKTKSRAMKFYGELKKPKPSPQQQQQPVSPGGRIAAFLNSIFRNSNGAPASRSHAPTTSTSTSTCSSASSFSRSCLSKTPSSRGKSSTSSTTTATTTTTKRSVRFYPVSVIVDEDSRPCGHKSLLKDDHYEFSKPLISNHHSSEKHHNNNNTNQRKMRREKEIDALMMMIKRNCQERTITRYNCDSDEEMKIINENDGGESCASSDLFELENLSSIGVGVGVGVSRYSEELPVYGTTILESLTA